MRYASETFDTVFFYNALFHVRRREEIVKESASVEREGQHIHSLNVETHVKDMFDDKAEWLNDFNCRREVRVWGSTASGAT